MSKSVKNPSYKAGKSAAKGSVAAGGTGVIAFVVAFMAPKIANWLQMDITVVIGALTGVVTGIMAFTKNWLKHRTVTVSQKG